MSVPAYFGFLLSLKFWFSLIVMLILRSVIKTWLLRKRMPPGPTPLPLLGNLLVFHGTKVGTHETMLELSKRYGDPMSVFFANTPTIVLTKYELAKSVLQQITFSSRVDSAMIDLVLDGSQNIVLAKYGPLWQFHRKITSKGMRSIIDTEKLEDKVVVAVDYTVQDMLKHPEKVEPKLHARHIVYNILASFAFGETYKVDDPEFLLLQDLSDRGNRAAGDLVVLDFLPFAKRLPLKWLPRVKNARGIFDKFKAIRTHQMEEHRRTFEKGDLRDFCDAILQEQELLKKEDPAQAEQLTDAHVTWILSDFFNAGTDTTSNVLIWFILYMTLNPQIQEECYQAIKEAIGDRPPRIADRTKLPFVEACIVETLRLRPAAPMGLPHAPISDTKIGDYFVPEGAITMANIYAMHIDPECWERPLEFNPKLHFIDEEGRLKKPTSFAPFGFGRRVCIGEQLARNDMFLAVVRLLQNVRFEPIDGVTYSYDYDVLQVLAFVALPYSIRISPRK